MVLPLYCRTPELLPHYRYQIGAPPIRMAAKRMMERRPCRCTNLAPRSTGRCLLLLGETLPHIFWIPTRVYILTAQNVSNSACSQEVQFCLEDMSSKLYRCFPFSGEVTRESFTSLAIQLLIPFDVIYPSVIWGPCAFWISWYTDFGGW